MTIEIAPNETKIVRNLLTDSQSIEIFLRGDNSRIEFVGWCVCGDNDDQKIEISIFHEAPNSSSKVSIFSGISGKAALEVNGQLIVDEKAVGSNAVYESRVVTLSDEARVVNIPSIEIKTAKADVKHRATVGRLDENQLYYLRARGLAQREAERLLLRGFFHEADEALLEKINKLI